MYTLYTDKSENFKCSIDVEGAKISDTQARLVLKNQDVNLLFEGKVSSDGSCIIPIKKLKNLLDEGVQGDIKLEVIAEGTYFSPWEDEFQVKTNKKVTVEVENNTSSNIVKENKISVKIDMPKKPTKNKVVKSRVNHGERISTLLESNGVNILNIKDNTLKVNNLVEKYIRKYKVSTTPNELITEIIKNLTKK